MRERGVLNVLFCVLCRALRTGGGGEMYSDGCTKIMKIRAIILYRAWKIDPNRYIK